MTRKADPTTAPDFLVADVQVACESDDIPVHEDIAKWTRRAYAAAAHDAGGEAEVAVRIVSEDEIRTLNRDYRGKDRVTNVLSFPAGDVAGLPADAIRILGDVVICADVVAKEAAEQGKPPADHWAHLLVHGMLHLLGYDHETDAEAAVMEDLEKQVLAAHNVPDPYRA